MKVGIINVGVNTSHGKLMSPIFDDDTFEFVPIPLDGAFEKFQKYSVFPRYNELRSPNKRSFSEFIPPRFLNKRTDNDPDLTRTENYPDLTSVPYTYGDWPTKNSKASNLKCLNPGDHLFFLSRLVNWRNENFTNEAGFYLVGFLEIERVFKEDELIEMAKSPRFDERFEMIKRNGHILMMRDRDTGLWLQDWNISWVFLGSRKSERFRYAVPFNRKLADEILLDAQGKKLTWPQNQTELQRIGSYTRSCKIIEERSRIDRLWEEVRRVNPSEGN